VAPRVSGLAEGNLELAPAVCQTCVWWQSRRGRTAAKEKWMERAEDTCAYLVTSAMPWVEQSLFLAAIGEARDKGAKALEAFAYRYPEGESTYERFLVHRTVFPRDFLADFGFGFVRAEGRVELARLELGGLAPVVEGKRASVLRVVKEAFAPAPVPQRP
jgi:hypothetical protein